MKDHNVKILVRLCDQTYDEELIKQAGIEVMVSFFGKFCSVTALFKILYQNKGKFSNNSSFLGLYVPRR
jgi:hypothetical protein